MNVYHLQARGVGLRTKRARAWQAATRKNVLLNKVSRVDVALKQCVVNHNALYAGMATGLKQLGHAGEIGGPVIFAHGLDHLHRANSVKGRVRDVAVVLQAQVGLLRHTEALHAGFGEIKLLGAQGHAGYMGTKGRGTHLRQRAPTATNLQHAAAGSDLGLFQHAAHLGALGLFQTLLHIPMKQSR